MTRDEIDDLLAERDRRRTRRADVEASVVVTAAVVEEATPEVAK